MALITCKDCKKEFSSDTKRCPHCGAKKPTSKVLRGLGVVLLLLVISKCVGQNLIEDAQQRAITRNPNLAMPITGVNAGNIPVQVPVNSWQVEEEKSKMDDSNTVILAKEADNTIDTWLSKARPSIIIRCQEHRSQLYMVTDTAAQPELGRYNKYTVEVRIDDRQPSKQLWSQSTDSKGLFAPNAVSLAKGLSKAGRVRIRFTPFNSPPATAEFDVSGLGAVLPKVASACKWNP